MSLPTKCPCGAITLPGYDKCGPCAIRSVEADMNTTMHAIPADRVHKISYSICNLLSRLDATPAESLAALMHAKESISAVFGIELAKLLSVAVQMPDPTTKPN